MTPCFPQPHPRVLRLQGTAKIDTQMLMARETKSRTAEEIAKTKIPDPVVVCTAFDKNRFGDLY